MKYLFIALALLASTCLASEGFSFKSVKMGVDIHTVLEIYRPAKGWGVDGPQVIARKQDGSIILTSSTASGFYFDTVAEVPCHTIFAFSPASKNDYDIIANELAATIQKSSARAKEALRKTRLYNVFIGFDQSYYETIKSALISKYGAPVKKESHSYQNGLGVSYQRELTAWVSGDCLIALNELGEDSNHSSLSYANFNYQPSIEEDRKKDL